MQELDFALDSVWASSVGITLQKPLSFTKAVPKRYTFNIAGRDGNLHCDTGVYNNRTAEGLCYALNAQDVSAIMPNVMAFLFGTSGYRKLTTSYDTTHYWKALITNGGEIAPRLNLLNPFAIEFEVMPYKIVASSDELVNNQTFVNPTGFISYPLIQVVSAAANDTLTCNNRVITFTDTISNLYIDCEAGACYGSGGTLYNEKISCTDFPIFTTGSNTITMSSLSDVIKVAPRWRTL